MIKRSGALLAILSLTLLLSACGKDERTLVKDAIVDMTCNVIKPMEEKMKTFDYQDPKQAEELQKFSEDSKNKMEAIVKNYGFENSDKFGEVAKKYDQDKALEEETRAAIKSTCNYDLPGSSSESGSEIPETK